MKKRILSLVLLAAACNASMNINPLRILQIDLIPQSCLVPPDPATGTATVIVAGGEPNYEFFLNGIPNPTGNVFTDLIGANQITVRDSAGTEVNASINAGPTSITFLSVSQAPFCENRYEQGIISFEISGATNPNSVLSQNGNQVEAINEGSGNFEPVAAGTYTVSGTDLSSPDCPGATASITFDLIIPQESDNDTVNFINSKYCIPCES